MSTTGYLYKGRWIEQYEHEFGEKSRLVWRVLLKPKGLILKKHLQSMNVAEKWVDEEGKHKDQ